METHREKMYLCSTETNSTTRSLVTTPTELSWPEALIIIEGYIKTEGKDKQGRIRNK
jgi:hypothetical protein